MMGNSNVPKLTLNIYYVTAEDTLFLKNIRSSDETCCKYEFITIKSDNSKIEVYSMNKKAIGVIYGCPTKDLLLDIYNRIYKS
jgi:hypothetical protein